MGIEILKLQYCWQITCNDAVSSAKTLFVNVRIQRIGISVTAAVSRTNSVTVAASTTR